MQSIVIFALSLLVLVMMVSSSTIYVQNKCPEAHPVVLRAAKDKVIAQGNIKPKQTWSHTFDSKSCESCNIATNTGQTLLAEFSSKGGKIWWNLSTDAGYQNPPFRFYASAPNTPKMYCNNIKCPHGHPGDSHINNVPEKYNLYVEYCG